MTARTFQVQVEGIGLFVFRRRAMADFSRIPNKALEILGGIPQHPILYDRAHMLAELEVLTVQAPDGWKLLEMDPLDDDDQAKFAEVHRRLIEEEARFRGRSTEKRAESGAGSEPDGGVRVPAPVSPPAD